VHELIVRINSITKTNSLVRLIAALQFLAEHHGYARPGGWVCIAFPISHQLLADMTGLARETITLSMKRLQQGKGVRYISVTRLEVHGRQLSKLG
jgi:CRP-like cAMP-binding protein